MTALDALDWGIVCIYIVGVLSFSYYVGRAQQKGSDYYVAGGQLGWFSVGMSMIATQSSSASAVGVPGFVLLRDNGGLKVLQYEIATPLSCIFVILVSIPVFRKMKVISIYQFLGWRFNSKVQKMMSAVFMLSRSAAAATQVYAAALVLSIVAGLSVEACTVLAGLLTLIFDIFGGMKAVVYSDVLQMGVLLAGLGMMIGIAVRDSGGIEGAFQKFPSERMRALDLSSGFTDADSLSTWAFIFAGVPYLATYYAFDQSQVQRQLAVKSLDEAKLSIVLNGLFRFPLTLLYCLTGIALVAFAEERGCFPGDDTASVDCDLEADDLVPEFIAQSLGSGVRGLMAVALLSAAMSSIDSALNSLSAAFMKDFVECSEWFQVYLTSPAYSSDRLDETKEKEIAAHEALTDELLQCSDVNDTPVDIEAPLNNKQQRLVLMVSKLVTLAIGAFIVALGYVIPYVSDSIVDSANLLSSAFYGPIWATFTMGIFAPSVNSKGILMGVPCGLLANVVIWVALPDVFWMWWNISGAAICYGVAFALSEKSVSEEGEYREEKLAKADFISDDPSMIHSNTPIHKVFPLSGSDWKLVLLLVTYFFFIIATLITFTLVW